MLQVSMPRVAIHGQQAPFLIEAIHSAGGRVVEIDEQPAGLVLDYSNDKTSLRSILDTTPSVQWVQLPSAGVEAYVDAMAAHPGMIWTSAKGAYAKPVAEHALALTLALLRRLPERAAATSWGQPGGTSLYGLAATVIGAGGIGLEVMRLFRAFDMQVDVVRRKSLPVSGARRTTTPQHLGEVLREADIVVVAAALTADSLNLIGKRELQAMKPEAILVNVARGGLVNTPALVDVLAAKRIAGIGLDVTEPEPLPADHPLWQEPRALITPHTADTLEMIRPLFAARVRDNVLRLRHGEDLEGLVDAQAGY